MARYDNLITGRAAGIEKLLREQKEKPPVSDAMIEALAAGDVRPLAKGKPAQAFGRMNKLERAYWDLLMLRLRAGEIVWAAYEPMKFRIGDNTFFSPDFGLMLPDGAIEWHETKGFWRDDARVKIKVAAEMYWMFSFVAVTRKGREWQYEPIGRN